MPIKIQRGLPAKSVLESENIFVMDEDRALSQDIRPLEILILNLMPIKYASAGGLHVPDDCLARIEEYFGKPSE